MKKTITATVAIFMILSIISGCGTSSPKIETEVKSVMLNLTEHTFTAAGDTFLLKSVILPETAENKDIAWSSSNAAIASVDENGLVTAKSNGKTAITALSKDSGIFATCYITVDIPADEPETEITEPEIEDITEEPEETPKVEEEEEAEKSIEDLAIVPEPEETTEPEEAVNETVEPEPKQNVEPEKEQEQETKKNSTTEENIKTIEVITYPQVIGVNQTATVKIKGLPNTEYYCGVEYESGWSASKSLGKAMSDENGYIAWSWKIGGNTSTTYRPKIWIYRVGEKKDEVELWFSVN